MENKKPEKHIISASATIPARRERVYSLIANYNDAHPRILPRQFTSLVVEQGGVGAGTIIRFQMRVLGKKQTFRAAITEPEPGRVLVETGLDANGAVTTFMVDPIRTSRSRPNFECGAASWEKSRRPSRLCCYAPCTSKNWRTWRVSPPDLLPADGP
jgi:hypothetical protein